MNNNKSAFNILYLCLVFILVSRIIAFLAGDSRLWGINHLVFLPDPILYIFAFLTFLILFLPLFRRAESAGQAVINYFNDIFFEKQYMIFYRLLFIMIMGLIFYIFRAQTHFLGDGYSWLNFLSDESTGIFKWSEKGAIYLLLAVQTLFGERNEITALTAFRIVSIISGMITIWLYFAIAGQLSKNLFRRFMIFAGLFFSGNLLLFFGYVEHYPVLWPMFMAFCYFSITYIKISKGLVLSAIFLLFGIIMHLQMAIFIPTWVYILLCRGRPNEYFKKYKTLFMTVIGMTIIAGIILFAREYNSNLYFENIFLPLLKGKPVDESYFILSSSHIIDIFNLLNLLSPMIILLIVSAFGGRQYFLKDRSVVFLLLIAGTSLAFTWVIDPKLGMPRDWDLLSLSAVGITLLCVVLISEKLIHKISKISFPLIIAFIILPLPYLLTVLNTNNTIEYFKYLIKLDKNKSVASAVVLRDYYRKIGNNTVADSLIEVNNRLFPKERNIGLGFNALEAGNIELAGNIIDDIKPDKFDPLYHILKSRYYHYNNNLDVALASSDSAIMLRAYDGHLLADRSQILSSKGEYQQALASVRKAYNLNSSDPYTIEVYINAHLNLYNYDSSLYYAHLLIRPPIEHPAGYYYLGRVSVSIGDLIKAREYIVYYVENCTDDPAYPTRSGEFRNVILHIDKELNK
jgi:hypothetical protein